MFAFAQEKSYNNRMKRILTMQDLSCVGQCSLTVALPILSAYGVETCVLPTAVLSNHTMFNGWSYLDLTDKIPEIYVPQPTIITLSQPETTLLSFSSAEEYALQVFTTEAGTSRISFNI